MCIQLNFSDLVINTVNVALEFRGIPMYVYNFRVNSNATENVVTFNLVYTEETDTAECIEFKVKEVELVTEKKECYYPIKRVTLYSKMILHFVEHYCV